jgi:ketosteroid isomerase-like protein
MAQTDTSPAGHKAVITTFYSLMNERRFDEMWALFTEDATWAGGGRESRFAAGIDHMKTVIVNPIPIFVTGGIDFTVHNTIAEGDFVAAEVESYAELVNGAVYNNHYHMLFRFRGSKIVEVKEYADTLHAKEVFVDSGAVTADRLGLDR